MAPNTRLLLVGPTHPFRGGIAHHTTLLAEALRARADTTFVSYRRLYVQALFPGATDKDHSESPIATAGVRYELDPLRPWTFVRIGREAQGYDAVILPWWVAFWTPFYGLLIAALRHRARLVFICHNVIEHEPHALKTLATRTILRQADALIVQSRAEAERVRTLVGDGKTIAICPHPTYDVFDRRAYTRESARASLGIGSDVPTVLFFGFVRPYKGLDVLLEAMPRLIEQRPDAVLLVVGECWHDEERYRAAAEQLGAHVRLVFQYVPNEEVERYVKASDVIALPYVSGSGSGIAQIALGMRVPVVATTVGAFDDVVVPGQTGELVPARDPVALADALARVLDPTRREDLQYAIERDRKRFSWAALADKVLELVRPR